MKKNLIFISSVIALSFLSCDKASEETSTRPYVVNADQVTIINDSIFGSVIKTDKVKMKPYSQEVQTSGVVQPISNQIAYVTSPFAGRIVRSHIKLGQKVNKGMPLFDVMCPDFLAVQKEYFQAESQLSLAERNMKRKEDLLAHNIGSQKEIDETKNELTIARKEYENALSALEIFQVNPKTMVLGEPLCVRAPISGTIIEDKVVTGSYLNEDAEPVVTVSDLKNVWVAAHVKEKDINLIHKGDDMKIYLSSNINSEIDGQVYHIDDIVDDETRSIRVLSICDNKDNQLKLGMYATVNFIDKEKDYLTVPQKALLQDETKTYVFVQTGKNTFEKRKVEVLFTKEGDAIVTGNITPEDTIITEGGYYLK